MNFAARAKELEPWIIGNRHWLHQHAELSLKEVETTAFLVRNLEEIGIPVQSYDDYYGYGILNIAGCVEALTGESDPTPEPSPDPAPEPTPDPEPSGESQPQPSPKPSPLPEPEPKPSPEPETERKTGFKDCPGNGGCVMVAYEDLDCVAWYHDGVHFALENGIMNGVSDQMFAPNSSTRQFRMTMCISSA